MSGVCHDLPPLCCYECESRVWWLAPDGRCVECTRLTPAQLTGVDAECEE